MRAVNKQYATTFNGDAFYFPDFMVCIFYDMWDKRYWVNVIRPAVSCQLPDKKLMSFSFVELGDAIEICDYILCKIALADAIFGIALADNLFGWI